MPDLPAQIALALEIAFALTGLMLLWRLVLSPVARARQASQLPALPAWDASLSDFFLFLWLVICTGLIVQFGASALLKPTSFDSDTKLLLAGTAIQLGMLLGIAIYRYGLTRRAFTAPLPANRGNPVIGGLITFLIALPLLTVVGLVWQKGLELVGIPAEKQDMIDLLAKSGSPALVITLVAFATLVAPITEELLFRAGIFRYTRTRAPRWLALLGPACLFGALHFNLASFLPLVALGVVFSLAYERTGDIRVTMVAHGLFNLNTVVIVLSGVGT